jgi:hypothetical protein
VDLLRPVSRFERGRFVVLDLALLLNVAARRGAP